MQSPYPRDLLKNYCAKIETAPQKQLKMVWPTGHQLQNGKYVIEEVLGKGGFGITYKAHHRELKDRVVIKTTYEYQKNNLKYDEYVRQFVREGQKMAQLSRESHPHIVRVRDLFWENDKPCLVMDFVPGENLFEAVKRRGRLPEAEAISCMRQIGDALAAIHQMGLVHRDIHPGNIILRNQNKAVLIDFGFAKEIVPSALSSTGSGGNRSFAPYELLVKGSREPKADVYCLAATMYYAVTGQCPEPALDRKLTDVALTPPQQLVPDLGDALNRVILKGMELEPRDRPSSMQEWLALLEESPLKTFGFEVVTVNNQGKEINRRRRQAQFFPENLGSGVSLEMVSIPGGKFWMGTDDEEIERLCKKYNVDYFRRERPQHEVTVQPFFMGKTPITQAQYQAIMGNNPSYFKGDKRPVECVSWYKAVEFCQKLSQQTGREYRLPSEAEWEYACRAGTTTPFHFGETITIDLANYCGKDRTERGWKGTYANESQGIYREQTTPVGSFPPNVFGLYDLHGNVWEWCLDDGHENYEGATSDGKAWLNDNSSQQGSSKVTANEKTRVSDDLTLDDTDENNSQLKVLRGGSWDFNPIYCRSAIRLRFNPDYRYYLIGFRVVCGSGRTP
jgi:formylglycine-generating enzyme required for sulfatase activity/tRNA A-37 threonylcarbamoyl transferase component Bud32